MTVDEGCSYAITYLARREYSQLELRRRLLTKGCEDNVINEVLIRLSAENLQSDQRFAQMVASSRINKGFGCFDIQHRLKIQNINDDMVEDVIGNALSENEESWHDVLLRVLIKKYPRYKDSRVEHGKIIRFFLSRGFLMEQIHGVLKQAK